MVDQNRHGLCREKAVSLSVDEKLFMVFLWVGRMSRLHCI